MVASHHPEASPSAQDTSTQRLSEREWVVARTFEASTRRVFEAWTTPELLRRWWAPKSFGVTFVSCEADVRTGGSYRFVMNAPSLPEPMAFFGRYLEVVPDTRLAWTNEEDCEAGPVTTVTFEEIDGRTRVVLHDLYPSASALDEAIASQSTSGFCETFQQLDRFLAEAEGA
jgi:uncharacterized protein YndB with AHSA1/START domain